MFHTFVYFTSVWTDLSQQMSDFLLLSPALVRFGVELVTEIVDLDVCLREVLGRLRDKFLLLLLNLNGLLGKLESRENIFKGDRSRHRHDT